VLLRVDGIFTEGDFVMKLASITTKAGNSIKLGKFTLLVGPNNVGKSQTLKDINTKLTKGHKAETTLINAIEVDRPASFDLFYEGLDVRIDQVNVGHHTIDGVTTSSDPNSKMVLQLEPHKSQFDANPDLDYTYLNFSKFRVFYLDSESRLKIASKSPNYIPAETSPKNFLQALYGAMGSFDEKLRDAFKATFDMDIRIDYSSGLELRLAVSKSFDVIPDDPRAAYPLMKKYPSIELQGDGYRSFVAVVLTLLLSKDRVVLLDEPEAFLHPEQARRLGKWLSDHTESFPCQIVIATHNSNFLAGLLSGRQPADIFRLNRLNDLTEFTKITSEATQSLSTSPLLSSQRVLEAIFARGVVVCESDADRILYNTVAIRKLDNQEILFIHAHNKQTIKLVVALLRHAAIPTVGVVDIDIFNSSKDFTETLTTFLDGQDFSEIAALQEEVATHIESSSEDKVLAEIKKKLSEFIDQLNDHQHTLSGARSALDRIKSESSLWADLKKHGISHLEEPLRSKASKVIEFSASHGLFIVPVGELESWIKLGVRKNRWIVPALEAIHMGNCPEELTDFVRKIQLFIFR
jgi:energy-coupling factor transporter ATP-binding protein EcfA2